MTQPTNDRPAPGWYTTGKPTVCEGCWKSIGTNARVLVTPPTIEQPSRPRLLCEPCGVTYLEQALAAAVALNPVEKVQLLSVATRRRASWALDIELAQGGGPLIPEERP